MAEGGPAEGEGRRSAEETVVLGVCPGPEPEQPVRDFHSDGSVVAADSD
jgi:hypothetical protein